jgi:DUF971 family protein
MAAMAELFPTEVRRLPGERRLRLTWSDGHVGEYDYRLLRGWCPCAFCQGHGAQSLAFHEPPGPVDLVGIEVVGHYALCFKWSDGHGSGIYRFDLLRELCPCRECAPAG